RYLHGDGSGLSTLGAGATQARADGAGSAPAIWACSCRGVSVSIGTLRAGKTSLTMGSAGFTLADRLGVKSLPCSVPGCTRTWISMASTGKGLKLGGRGAADPSDPASSMCDPCREKLAKTSDLERPCDRPGCSGKWTWPVAAQLE